MSNFQNDLQYGQKYEEKALKYLDYDTVEHMEGYFKEYDLIITKDEVKTKIEVKSDRRAQFTKNLAIEFECNGKPSGVSTSEADYWMYFIVYDDRNDEVFKIPVSELKKLIKNCRTAWGGDGYRSRLKLLPRIKCLKYLACQT